MISNERTYWFRAGAEGLWRVQSIRAVRGESLPAADRLDIAPAESGSGQPAWTLKGVVSNLRYTTQLEREELSARQVSPGRFENARGALIPIRKTADWWDLAQDERRRIFEESSRHIQLGMRYLPAISRRLHHCRDLGAAEPFDFITWFDFAPEHSEAFEELVGILRATEEWSFVEREVDVRVERP